MTLLGLALAVNMDDTFVHIRRWQMRMVGGMLVPVFAFGWQMQARVQRLEDTPTSALVVEGRLQSLEGDRSAANDKFKQYDELRVKREREVATLEANQAAVDKKLDQMDRKLDLLLASRTH